MEKISQRLLQKSEDTQNNEVLERGTQPPPRPGVPGLLIAAVGTGWDRTSWGGNHQGWPGALWGQKTPWQVPTGRKKHLERDFFLTAMIPPNVASVGHNEHPKMRVQALDLASGWALWPRTLPTLIKDIGAKLEAKPPPNYLPSLIKAAYPWSIRCQCSLERVLSFCPNPKHRTHPKGSWRGARRGWDPQPWGARSRRAPQGGGQRAACSRDGNLVPKVKRASLLSA